MSKPDTKYVRMLELMPATAQEVLLRFRVDLHNALEQALFFGASREALYTAAEAELHDALASLHPNGPDL